MHEQLSHYDKNLEKYVDKLDINNRSRLVNSRYFRNVQKHANGI